MTDRAAHSPIETTTERQDEMFVKMQTVWSADWPTSEQSKPSRKAIPCKSVEDAARIAEAWRDANGYMGSQWMPAQVIDDAGVVIATISYNGRIWPVE